MLYFAVNLVYAYLQLAFGPHYFIVSFWAQVLNAYVKTLTDWLRTLYRMALRTGATTSPAAVHQDQAAKHGILQQDSLETVPQGMA